MAGEILSQEIQAQSDIEQLARLLHAVDSTKLSLHARNSIGLPIVVGDGINSFQAGIGPTLLDLKSDFWNTPIDICDEAEKNLWLSRHDKDTPKSVLVFNELLEVKFTELVTALPRRTFEYIDLSGRGHVFIKNVWYIPLPSLYPGAPVDVAKVKEYSNWIEMGITINTVSLPEILKQTIWRATRRFHEKRYVFVEESAKLAYPDLGI